MNSFAEIARALSEGVGDLQVQDWHHIPLSSGAELRLLPSGPGGELLAVLARQGAHRSAKAAEATRLNLLRIGADTRWTDAFSGGVDENGWECIAVRLRMPQDAQAIEETLHRMQARIQAATGESPTGQVRPVCTWGLP